MIEIIPNWHPLFVHFTVALFSTAVGFYILSYVTARIPVFQNSLVKEFETVARWCLWVVSLLTIITVMAGLQAYYTVNHDTPSHLAMTNHRNWAIPTAIGIVLVALWSIWRYQKGKAVTVSFLIGLLIVQGLLLSTAWRGAELVFRYGIGVMSLPKPEGVGHNHSHPNTATTTSSPQAATSSSAEPAGHDQSDMDEHNNGNDHH